MEKYIVTYQSGQAVEQCGRMRAQSQIPEINFNIFDHFNLKSISMVQTDGNEIVITRGPDKCYRCGCPDLTYADKTWGCDNCGQLQ